MLGGNKISKMKPSKKIKSSNVRIERKGWQCGYFEKVCPKLTIFASRFRSLWKKYPPKTWKVDVITILLSSSRNPKESRWPMSWNRFRSWKSTIWINARRIFVCREKCKWKVGLLEIVDPQLLNLTEHIFVSEKKTLWVFSHLKDLLYLKDHPSEFQRFITMVIGFRPEEPGLLPPSKLPMAHGWKKKG